MVFLLHWSGVDRHTDTIPKHENPFASLTKAGASTQNGQLNGTENRTVTSIEVDNPVSNAIDLNFSTSRELEALPGIGPILAKRIVDHRKLVGEFQSIQDLDRVKGIGAKKLQALRPLVKISSKNNSTKRQGEELKS